ncbi:hypothetical protein, partial [Klebsiella oxytoca]|uniref:hypothetical protein n=1 Tax=Klebsiella oxytoca TaxID=571 RepID=UPI001CCE9315
NQRCALFSEAHKPFLAQGNCSLFFIQSSALSQEAIIIISGFDGGQDAVKRVKKTKHHYLSIAYKTKIAIKLFCRF